MYVFRSVVISELRCPARQDCRCPTASERRLHPCSHRKYGLCCGPTIHRLLETSSQQARGRSCTSTQTNRTAQAGLGRVAIWTVRCGTRRRIQFLEKENARPKKILPEGSLIVPIFPALLFPKRFQSVDEWGRGSMSIAAIHPVIPPPKCVSQASCPFSAHHITTFSVTSKAATRATGQSVSRRVKRSK